MARTRGRPAGAGASATSEWRRAAGIARRAKVLSTLLALTAVGLCLLGLWQGDGRPVVLGGVTALAAWWRRPDRDADRWLRGAEGEKATAALLAGLPRGWIVLHDRTVPGRRANIDHLVIGPTGVWVVDSKAVRARLRVKHRAVWAGGHRIDTGPAAWEADVASRLLAVDVVPIVAVHGQPLRRRGVWCDGVRVLPARRLVRRLRRGRRVLRRSDVAALVRRADEVLAPG